MRATKDGARRPTRGRAPLALAAALLAAGVATASAEEDWVPTGYDEHASAAWSFLALSCGPEYPATYAGPAEADLCQSLFDVSQVWLGFVLAWTELPANAANAGELQIFPKLEPEAMRKLAVLAAEVEPQWAIAANPDLAGAPESIRQQLLDSATRSYDIAARTTLIRAKINDPAVLTLD